ncbi:MAG: alpha/beta hydrolase domain-containing protein [Alphaproteobacteria bacterium]|nr:alpha/beta hydrolase domain-containing protein [Alphaproteobacteria bacterium]
MTNEIELRISEQTSFADGHEFGETGAFEKLVGRAHFAVDPEAPAQAGIVDIDKAPRNDKGLVEFTSDICILRPADLSRGNKRVFFDYGNRGNMRALQFFNDAPGSNNPQSLADAGNGYLFRRGYTVVWGAWQGDLLPGNGRMLLDLPIAREADGPITGPVRIEIIADSPGLTTFPLSGGRASTRSHPTISLDTREARLTRRRYATDERIEVPADQWCFARLESGAGLDMQGAETSLIPSDSNIHIPTGFETGWIYELVYTGRDPLVLGLGHVAVRDLVSFLKYAETDRAGNPNPAGGPEMVEKAYSWGRSQTGRCIRDSLYNGYNADAEGRRVFDGVMPHVAGAGRMWMNHRFANVITPAGQHYEDHDNRADKFPFSYAESTDHLTGKTDAILKRPDTDPLVIHTQTGTEYWQRRGSLVHTDTQGNDLEQPDTVRAYFWSSSQHFANPNLQAPTRGVCQNDCCVTTTSMLFRSTLDALDRWATDGVAPPPSRIPRRADGTLVTWAEWKTQFPAIPGVATPQSANGLPLLDFGPDEDKGILSQEPPNVVDAAGYTILVPAVDADGNDIAGIRVPMVSAPLGTYTGWNLRARGYGEGAMHEFTGSTMPFPETPEHRQATGDPRRSIQERYQNLDGYVRAIREAAMTLVEDGLMLEEDVERAVELARGWSAPRHSVSLD